MVEWRTSSVDPIDLNGASSFLSDTQSPRGSKCCNERRGGERRGDERRGDVRRGDVRRGDERCESGKGVMYGASVRSLAFSHLLVRIGGGHLRGLILLVVVSKKLTRSCRLRFCGGGVGIEEVMA